MKLLILLSIILASHEAIANDLKNDTLSSVLLSLQCEQKDAGKILAAFRDLVRQKSALAGVGIDYFQVGEEMDEKITLKFKDGLELYGSKANQAEMVIDGGDFIVYGDFSGDPDPIIKRLGLKKNDPDHKQDYVNPRTSNNCDPIQHLRKIGPRKFRFGCGWCNG